MKIRFTANTAGLLLLIVTTVVLLLGAFTSIARAQAQTWLGDSKTGTVIELPLPPEKEAPQHPRLDWALSQAVERYESGQATEAQAAAQAPLHHNGAALVTVYLRGNSQTTAEWLAAKGVTVRNQGADYLEAPVPVSLLGSLSEQAGVVRVAAVVPPQPGAGRSPGHRPLYTGETGGTKPEPSGRPEAAGSEETPRHRPDGS